MFEGKAFKLTGVPMAMIEKIHFSREDREVLKLCDLDDMTQAEAGVKMGVSRYLQSQGRRPRKV
jgi:predicted DNA-binding protein (UPF0251 family)